jgi:DNA polymerase-3 subunit gamma/tau
VLRRAADAESIEIPPTALAAIARSATGSFRDALGTLEQLVTYSGRSIALDDVLAVLGVADAELLAESFDAVADADPRRALLTLHRCVESGRDATSFASDLEVHARELLVVRTLGSVPAELSVTPEVDAALAAQAERVPPGAVVRVLELLAAALEAVRAGADPRTQLELALVKAAAPEVDGSTRALLARIERLEAALAQGGVAAPAAAAGGAGAPATPEASPSAPRSPVSSSNGEVAVTAEPPPARPEEPAISVPEPASAPQLSPSAPVARPLSTVAPSAAPARGQVTAAVESRSGPASAAATVPAPDAAPAPVGPSRPSTSDLDSLQSLWPAVLDTVRTENSLLAALIADARPVALQEDELTVAFAPTAAFLKKKAEDQANRRMVGEALHTVTGQRLRLKYELREDALPVAADQAAPTEEEWVRRFMAEFDAEELPEHQPEGD